MLAESVADKMDTDDISIDVVDAMYVGEGESMPEICLRMGSTQSEEQDSALIIYGRNSRPDNYRRTKLPVIPKNISEYDLRVRGGKKPQTHQGYNSREVASNSECFMRKSI